MAGQTDYLNGMGPMEGAGEAETRQEAPVGEHRPPPPHAAAQAMPPVGTEEHLRMERRLAEIRKKREAECMMPVAGSRLFTVYRQVRGFFPPTQRDKYSLAVFMEDAELPEAEQKLWLMGIERETRIKPQFNPPPRPGRNTSEAAAEQMQAKYKAWEARAYDAESFVRVNSDAMAAWVFVLPPVNGGQGPTVADLEAHLHYQGVGFGIDRERLEDICLNERYLQLIRVAFGDPPKNGIDGDVIDHFKRQAEIELVEQDDGTIDYRELGWLQTVYEGDIICDIIPPYPPEDGTDVRGRPVQGKPGRKATVPGGPGTRIAKDDTLLVAAMDGVVSFSNQRFRVEPLLTVKGDVDTAVGNLDVLGSVLITGDVREGFSVTASGDITVRGMVEECTLNAGGNLQVGAGINGGMEGGLMRAGGTVMCRFIENANVVAGGQVACETIVNSVVYCDDAVIAKAGRGAIIGGAITARNLIEAKTVGNASNRSMSVILGYGAEFIREQRELERRRDELEDEIAEKEKSVRYLLAAGTSITQAEKKQMEDLEVGAKALRMQLRGLQQKLDAMEQSPSCNMDCRLVTDTLHPPVEVNLCGRQTVIIETYKKIKVFLRDGEVE